MLKDRFFYSLRVLRKLVERDLFARFSTPLMGNSWLVLEPILLLSVYYLFVTAFLGVKSEHYLISLFCGIVPFTYFQNTIQANTSALTRYRALLRGGIVDIKLLPFISLISNLFPHAVLILALMILGWLSGTLTILGVLCLPIAMVSLAIFSALISFIIMIANVFFKDIEFIVTLGLRLAVFFCPIFFSADKVPKPFYYFYVAFPLNSIIESYRNVILYGKLPTLFVFGAWIVAYLCLILIARALFVSVSNKITDQL